MPTAESRLHLRIPCDSGLHWRFIELLIPLEEGELALATLTDLTNASIPRWLLAEPDGEVECHSHARVLDWRAPADADDPEGQRAPVQLVEIETYRYGVVPDDRKGYSVSHARFFSALRDSTSVDELFVVANVRLSFSAQTSTWQAALLASPPDIAELPGDLGKISLSGLSLRFRDSRLGLLDARLESGPENDYSVEVRFSVSIPTDEIARLYQTILQRAEQLASLFVVTSS